MSARSVGNLTAAKGFTPGAAEFDDASEARTRDVPESIAPVPSIDEGN